jgi:ferredoxin
MAYRIGSKCINCDMCEMECPNGAIRMGREIYEIDPDKCTECRGFYDSPTCVRVCPIHCIKKIEEKDQKQEGKKTSRQK